MKKTNRKPKASPELPALQELLEINCVHCGKPNPIDVTRCIHCRGNIRK